MTFLIPRSVRSFGGAAGMAEAWTRIEKETDEAKTNDNVLADDPVLFFSMAANTVYAIRTRILFSSNDTANIRYRFTGPDSPTLYLEAIARAGAGEVPAWLAVATAYTAIDIILSLGAGGHGMIFSDWIIHNGANAGNFRFRWAQQTAEANPTTVRGGSYLEYMAF